MKNIDDKVLIYLVDDDELFLKIIETKFRSVTHFHLLTFNSPEMFLEYLSHTKIPPKVLQIGLLDFYFLNKFDNQLDGIQTLDKITEQHPEIKIILVSQRKDAELMNIAKEHGAFKFIPKSEDAFMRILNQVRWLVSNHAVKLAEGRKNRALYLFFALVFIGVLTFIYNQFIT